ncbi:MAG TPA: MBL fold metallo-hydrolase [Terriglobia bacterium]|nr:MBL fold metallo-hydrolase [Terriglobia bacterium]
MKRIIALGAIVGAGALCMTLAAFQGPPARGGAPGGAAGRGGFPGGGAGRGAGPGGGRAGGGAGGGANVAQIEKVKDNLYMLTGGGGNTAAFITDTGVVVVDTKLAGWGQAILDKIKTVTDKPVTMIINTHTHGDHTGSNNFFDPKVEFVAHENTRANMEKMDPFKGDGAKFLPKKTFKDKTTLLTGKNQIDLYYFGPGHTNGDTWVVFKALNTMHAGDLFAGKTTPIIDASNGGSAIEYGKTLEKAFNGIKGVDTIITGHSTVMKPADLKEYADFNNDFATWVQTEMKAGKTVDAAAAEYKIPAKYAGYTIQTMMGGVRGNIQTAYDELNKKK